MKTKDNINTSDLLFLPREISIAEFSLIIGKSTRTTQEKIKNKQIYKLNKGIDFRKSIVAYISSLDRESKTFSAQNAAKKKHYGSKISLSENSGNNIEEKLMIAELARKNAVTDSIFIKNKEKIAEIATEISTSYFIKTTHILQKLRDFLNEKLPIDLQNEIIKLIKNSVENLKNKHIEINELNIDTILTYEEINDV